MSSKLAVPSVNRVWTHTDRRRLESVIQNEFSSLRSMFGDYLSTGKRTRKNIAKECDYPTGPYDAGFYRRLYDYDGIATRVVDVDARETWKFFPLVYETEKPRITSWEAEYQKFILSPIDPLGKMATADRLSGIGRFGGLIIGVNDKRKMSEPAAKMDVDGNLIPVKNRQKLLFLRPFDEFTCRINDIDMNTNSPRFGCPLTYDLDIVSPNSTMKGRSSTTMKVHWTRVLHFAGDNTNDTEWAGTPRLQNVIPQIWNLQKIIGGDAEMFWQGAFPGMSVEAIPELFAQGLNPTLDEESVKAQIDAYRLGLQRYISLIGATAKSLAPNISDPTPHVEQQLRILCAAINCPLRIFIGTEAGHMASTQDRKKRDDDISGRRRLYASPKVVKYSLDRFAALGVLPTYRKLYYDEWVDPNKGVDETKASTALKYAQALSQYAGSNAPSVVGPINFLTRVFGMTEEVARNSYAEAKATKKTVLPKDPKPQKAGGMRTGTSPGRKKGKPGNKS